MCHKSLWPLTNIPLTEYHYDHDPRRYMTKWIMTVWPNLNLLFFKLFDPEVPKRSPFQKQLPKMTLWFIFSQSAFYLSYYKVRVSSIEPVIIQTPASRQSGLKFKQCLCAKTHIFTQFECRSCKCSLEVSGTEQEVRGSRERGLQAKGIQKQVWGVALMEEFPAAGPQIILALEAWRLESLCIYIIRSQGATRREKPQVLPLFLNTSI